MKYPRASQLLIGAVIWSWLCISIAARSVTTIAQFDGTDGLTPKDSLIQGIDGDFYGTAYYGGAHSGGTVFKVSPSGELTAVYSFCSKRQCRDGSGPESSLLLSTNGEFYGTTFWGGNGMGGTTFKMNSKGKVSTLMKFSTPSSPDGLVQGSDGNFYGTTYWGGNGGGCLPGYVSCGTVFRMTPAGNVSTLYGFCSQLNCVDGGLPWAGLIQGSDGYFYGTTYGGGANCEGVGSLGCGTVFKVAFDGSLTTLYSFCSEANCADGAWPIAGLVQGTDGNYYGSTPAGGNGEEGTIFRIAPDGQFDTLYSFCSEPSCADGESPSGSLIQGTDGSFYGVTAGGGLNNSGTIFQFTSGFALNTLYSFCSQPNCADGDQPSGGLLQGTDGNFYGTTSSTVFRLSMGLPPFVSTQPTYGDIGSKVVILGSNLLGASAVSFNGSPAKFKVLSTTEISTKVPGGASSGFIAVTTPKGILYSKLPFSVTP